MHAITKRLTFLFYFSTILIALPTYRPLAVDFCLFDDIRTPSTEIVDAVIIPIITNGDITLPTEKLNFEQIVAILRRHLELAQMQEIHFPVLC